VRVPHFTKGTHIHTKESYVYTKETYICTKETYIYTKETYTCTKETTVYTMNTHKRPYILQRDLHKRDLCMHKRDISVYDEYTKESLHTSKRPTTKRPIHACTKETSVYTMNTQ